MDNVLVIQSSTSLRRDDTIIVCNTTNNQVDMFLSSACVFNYSTMYFDILHTECRCRTYYSVQRHPGILIIFDALFIWLSDIFYFGDFPLPIVHPAWLPLVRRFKSLFIPGEKNDIHCRQPTP